MVTGRKPTGKPVGRRPTEDTPLTPSQRAFVAEYFRNGQKKSAAYRVAFPNAKGSPRSIGVDVNVLLQHPAVARALREGHKKADKAMERAFDEYAVSKERIIREMARLAFVDPRKLFIWGPKGVKVRNSEDLTDDEAAAVVAVRQTGGGKKGPTITIELADKRAALMDLAKLHDYLKVEMTIKGDKDNPILIQQQQEARQMLMDELQRMAIPEPLTIEGTAEEEPTRGPARADPRFPP